MGIEVTHAQVDCESSIGQTIQFGPGQIESVARGSLPGQSIMMAPCLAHYGTAFILGRLQKLLERGGAKIWSESARC